MSEKNARSVAEKLAAAKRKHKAYMKEKGLKNNVVKIKTTEEADCEYKPAGDIMPITNTQLMEDKPVLAFDQNQTETVNLQSSVQNTDPYEADFPLPQYSTDFNKKYQESSLPDPLSFFDNFSNVGTTFQNLTQPLTSFFSNDSNGNHSTTDTTEQPNQILIEDISSNDSTKVENFSLPKKEGAQEMFSYDRFKSNAINPHSFEDSELRKPQEYLIFDQFTNTNSMVSDSINIPNKGNEEIFSTAIQDIPLVDFKQNGPSYPPNIFDSSLEINQNISPANLEVKQEVIETQTNINGEHNVENKEVDEPNVVVNNSRDLDDLPSNLEGLLRISNEMEALIKKESVSVYPQNEDLAKQNQDLLALLEQQNLKCHQLSTQLYESEVQYSKLLTDFKTLEIQRENSSTDMNLKADIELQNDLSKLREDLQCHLQTIGMLVAEKTELSSLLHEVQTALRSETSQRIDLENQIKDIKLFHSSIEHELEELKSEKLNLSSSHKDQADLYKTVQKEYEDMKNRHEELTQDFLESKERLKSMTENNSKLQKQVQDLDSQLSMANIKIQQLSMGGTQQETQVDKLMEEKFANEKQISFLNDTLRTITKEREESSLQYQQYAQQLNDQITNLAARLDHYQRENDQLRIQEETRIKHIGELEKQLQNIQNDSSSLNMQRNNSSLKKDLELSSELAKTLQDEKDELSVNLNKAIIDKGLLEKELEGCKFSISQLETTVEQLRGSQPDNAVLLATMESDKVAASRAITQNNELKRQMESMQEVLLKVNNDNVQLTESISTERRINKELLDKLQKTEISLQTLAEAIEIKDKEMVSLRDELEKINKRIVQQEQISDRLRHYEARDNSSSSLQSELQDAKHMIAHLTNELNILKMNQLNQRNQMNQTNEIDQTNQITQTSELNRSENDESRQEVVLIELKSQLNNLQMRNNELESLLQNFNATGPRSIDTNGNENLDKETAMKHLEKKFLKTMEDIALLTEEKQRLEHLVMQLQGETETIGEYVTLYQQQRSILKQRALEKDQQLQQLTNDRETIKANLDRLNNLVNKLIIEKGAITKELLEQHEHFSKERDDLCAEHQKIHQEINKITSGSLKNSQVSSDANTQIAEEIISLLSEIKSSNLVEPVEGIHHCPWCSGKLITV